MVVLITLAVSLLQEINRYPHPVPSVGDFLQCMENRALNVWSVNTKEKCLGTIEKDKALLFNILPLLIQER